jgi:hypothetical protein
MLKTDIDGNFYPPKIRTPLFVISMIFGLASLCTLLFGQDSSVKVIGMYIFAASIMHILILCKNTVNKYEVGIFLFLCIQLISSAPPPDGMGSGLILNSYLLSYRYGISSRSFIATIVDLLTRGFISKYFLWHFIFCSLVFLSFLIAVYIGTTIQKNKNGVKTFVLFLSLLYLSCFTSPSTYFEYWNFGRLEMFALIFMFILAAVIDKPGIRWFVPAIALFTLGTHLILVFFYIPFIFIMLLYRPFHDEDNRKQNVILLAVTFCLVVFYFAVYLLIHEQTFVFATARDFAEYLAQKTDVVLSEGDIHVMLYAKLSEHTNVWKNAMALDYRGNVSILINLPVTAFFAVFWIKAFFHEKKKSMKLFFLLPVLMILYQAIAFFIFIDFGRWMVMIVTSQFLLVFYLLHVQNDTVLSVARETVKVIIRFWYIIILACILMAYLGPVDAIGPSDKVKQIILAVVQAFK